MNKPFRLNYFPFIILFSVAFLFFAIIYAIISNSSSQKSKSFRLFDVQKSKIYHRLDSNHSLDEIRNLELDQWTEMKASNLPYGYINEVAWIKFYIENKNQYPDEIIVLLDQTGLDSIDIFQFDQGILKYHSNQGDILNFDERESRIRFFSFRVNLDSNSKYEIFLKIKSSGSLNTNIKLFDKNSFVDFTSRDNFFFGLFFGFSVAILIYNIVILIFTAEISFLFSALTLFLYFCTLFSAYGFGYMYFYSHFPFIQSRVYLGTNIITNMLMLLLFSRILITKSKSPKMNYILLSFLFPLSILFILHLYKPNHLFYNCVHILNFTSILILAIASTISFRKDNIVKYYILALLILIFTFLPIFLSLGGVAIAEEFSYYSFLFSSSFVLIIITSAMGRKVYNYKFERDHYILKLLRSQKQNNRNLENKVKEKTAELTKNLQNISNDLELARSLQIATLPILENISIPNFQIAGSFLPRDRVGGDIFDVFEMEDGRIRAFIADVTGHGIQAALVTMSIRAEFDRIKKRDMPVEKVLRQLNRTIIASFSDSPLYASAFIVEIDRQNQRIRYASAGHPDQYLVTNGKTFILEPQSRILGIHDDTELFFQEISVMSPFSLYLFTDGAFEFLSDDNIVFGEDRLRTLLQKEDRGTLHDKLNDVYTELFEFVAEKGFQDDVTMLFLREDGIMKKPSPMHS